MSFPAALTLVPLHGQILRADSTGTPASGTVTFRIEQALRDTADNVLLAPTTLTATLDDTGSFTISLPTTDDPDVTPQGWTYVVTINTDAVRDTWRISVPAATVGTLELADIAPAVTPPTLVTYLLASTVGQVGGPAGPLDSNGHVPSAQIPGGGGSGVSLGGDLGGTNGSPQVVGTHLSSPLALTQGGTAATSASAARTSLGAEVAGAATTAVTTHTAASDPHGDRADAAAKYVKLAGGSVIVIGEGDVTTQALAIHLPTGDRTAGNAPDTIGVYVNTGTAGSPTWTRTGYLNEYGMPRVISIADNQVPMKVKQHSGTQSADLFQAVDINNNALASIDATGGGHFPGVQIGGANAATDHGYSPADYGLLAWVGDPGYLAGSLAVPAGIVHLMKVKVPKAITITNIVLYMAGAVSLTSGQNFAALFDMSGNRLGVTADQTTNWSTAGSKTCALTAPYSAAAGFYYVGVLFNGTTIPSMGRFGQNTIYANASIGSLVRFGQYGSSQTAMPSSLTMGSVAANSTAAFWAGVS